MPTSKVFCYCGILCHAPREVSVSTWRLHNKKAEALGGTAMPQYDQKSTSQEFWDVHRRRNQELANAAPTASVQSRKRKAVDSEEEEHTENVVGANQGLQNTVRTLLVLRRVCLAASKLCWRDCRCERKFDCRRPKPSSRSRSRFCGCICATGTSITLTLGIVLIGSTACRLAEDGKRISSMWRS